ncbi:MAG TPA: ATP-binding protein [Pirellulales bacterium]|nr:ATP-binding protein [Pirellulales bacterium]
MPSWPALTRDPRTMNFEDLIQRSADAILVVLDTGQVVYANRAAEALFGWSTDGDGRRRELAITGLGTSEVALPALGGQERIAEMRVVASEWEGQPAYLASLREITDRKHAADALRFLADASRSLAGLLDYPATIDEVARLAVAHLADWCVLDLLDGDRVFRTGCASPGLAPGGSTPILHATWILKPGQSSVLADVIRSGQAHTYADLPSERLCALVASPGNCDGIRQLGCHAAMALPLIARGRLIGTITCVAASEARQFGRAELALAADLAGRGALAIDTARLYEQSRSAVRHRDRFLAMLAHELRNPLAAIFSAVELMRQSDDVARVLRRTEEVIERQGRHMARLLDELLDISRVTHGKIELRKSAIDLCSLVRDTVLANETLIRGREHQIVTELSDAPLWVDGDSTRLEQVLTNLLHNAVKYMEPGGTIHVSTRVEEDRAVLSVRDAGTGIAANDLPHVFDLFVQADRSLDRAQGGLGVGLTLVRHLVEMHGGSVSARSEGAGLGSEFTVELLRVAQPAVPTATRELRVTTKRRRRVVIVEDNADAREMLQMLLAVEGHDVDSAEDGRDGLALIERVRPDVALIDIGLPLLNGYDVARKLRARSQGAPVLLVALTGYGQPEDRQRALAAGFDEHLIKPVNLDDLTQIMSRSPAATMR